jgi:hypothetical protein
MSAGEAMQTVRDNLAHLHPIHLEAVNIETCVANAIRRPTAAWGRSTESGSLLKAAERTCVGLQFMRMLNHVRGCRTISGCLEFGEIT